MNKSIKGIILHTLLISYIYLPLCMSQQLSSHTGSLSSTIPNTHFQGTGSLPNTIFQGAGTVPNTHFQGASALGGTGAVQNTFIQGAPSNFAARGYSNTPVVPNTYLNAPVHGQFWTGHVQPYPQQYGNYYNPAYAGYNQYGSGYYPATPYQHYPQQYPAYGQYDQYGYYPNFDAQYWTGSHFPQVYSPVYQQHGVPVYHHGMVYPGQYVHHPQYARGYPYPYKPYKKGFLGGTGSGLAKTLLGAVVVGTVAGAVARG
ncbi:hypothetical protein ACF0H5_017220 [Mactra antiquata]